MSQYEVKQRYFQWICKAVCGRDSHKRLYYKQLLRRLHETPFHYTIGMDGNRAADGVNLRYRFGSEKHYDYAMIATYLDDRECSVLEMMAALAIRCEEHIMEDYDLGNRTSKWFWTMIESLGLMPMSDEQFDENYFSACMERFMNREFDRDGRGGLFTVPNCRRDMRTTEIWYQMAAYLEFILDKRA